MFGTFDPAALAASLQIMWQGMLGIFVVMSAITALVWSFTHFGKKK